MRVTDVTTQAVVALTNTILHLYAITGPLVMCLFWVRDAPWAMG
jgi:hypothetical protein